MPGRPAATALALSVLGPVAESARALSQAVALRAAAARVDATPSRPPPSPRRPPLHVPCLPDHWASGCTE